MGNATKRKRRRSPAADRTESAADIAESEPKRSVPRDSWQWIKYPSDAVSGLASAVSWVFRLPSRFVKVAFGKVLVSSVKYYRLIRLAGRLEFDSVE
jgi:hypothetical protein